MNHKRLFLLLCAVSVLLWSMAFFRINTVSGAKTIILTDTNVNELVSNPVRELGETEQRQTETEEKSGKTDADNPEKTEVKNKPEPDCINVNTADKKRLSSLPGVGKVISERIFNYRIENGKFSDIEQLMDVKGIGPARLEKMSGMICF